MTAPNYPSTVPTHRRADLAVHAFGLSVILIAGGVLIVHAATKITGALVLAAMVYVFSALVSNVASWMYHFAPWHGLSYSPFVGQGLA